MTAVFKSIVWRNTMEPSNDSPKKVSKKGVLFSAFVLLSLVVLLKRDSGDSPQKPLTDKKWGHIETNVDVNDVKSNPKDQKKRHRTNKWRKNRAIALFGMTYDELVDTPCGESLAQIDEQDGYELNDEQLAARNLDSIA